MVVILGSRIALMQKVALLSYLDPVFSDINFKSQNSSCPLHSLSYFLDFVEIFFASFSDVFFNYKDIFQALILVYIFVALIPFFATKYICLRQMLLSTGGTSHYQVGLHILMAVLVIKHSFRHYIHYIYNVFATMNAIDTNMGCILRFCIIFASTLLRYV